MAHILVADDDEAVCDALCRCVQHMGHTGDRALTLGDALNVLRRGAFDVVFLDVRFPDGNGLRALPSIREQHPNLEVVIITGEADENDAELAIFSGAWDYVKKPLSVPEIKLQLTQLLHYQKERLAHRTAVALKRDELVGESPPMKACLDLLIQAASSDASVLVTGETGTGKELFCRAIHENSPRADGRFVVVDCASLPGTLIESILFGHVKGAFTGADTAQPGVIKEADGGTLFLDEIGELPLSMQRAFLRVLQEHRFRPVGSHEELHSNFRLVAATNRDLAQMTQDGQFRHDLLFRVQSHRIDLPPLRERREDIRHIVGHHLTRLCKRRNIAQKTYSPDFLEALEVHSWPGNVRELVGILERALAAAGAEEVLFVGHLPIELRVARTRRAIQSAPSSGKAVEEDHAARPLPTYRDYRKHAADEAEKRYLEQLLVVAEGDLAVACHVSDLSRSRIYQLLQKHGMSL